jgi:hypothetical protein
LTVKRGNVERYKKPVLGRRVGHREDIEGRDFQAE